MAFKHNWLTQKGSGWDLLKRKHSVEKYLNLMELFNDVVGTGNPASLDSFISQFIGFYAIQGIPRAIISDVTKELLSKKLSRTFDAVIDRVSNLTGRCDVVFSSKIIHTFDTNMPLVDKFVEASLGITRESYFADKHAITVAEKANAIKDLYHSYICPQFRLHLKDPDVLSVLKDFDAHFLDAAGISDVKKLDFILFSNRTGIYASVLDRPAIHQTPTLRV